MALLLGDIDAQLKLATGMLANNSAAPRLDAELLMAHALGMERGQMLMRRKDLTVPENYQSLIERRIACEPIAYIIGAQDFWDISLYITPDVLIPRADSETMIEWVAAHYKDNAPRTILDLGTGSGALLLAALSVFPKARGVGVDKSQAALEIARKNAVANAMDDRCDFMFGDWTQCDDALTAERFDLILCNPPYIANDEILMRDVADYEPKIALFADNEGYSDYQILIPMMHKLLAKGGAIFFEIGATQASDVIKIANQNFYLSDIKQDLSGLDRVLMLTQIADC